MDSSCPYCGWPDADPPRELSRHRTSTGETVWTRCGCGSLQMRLLDETGAEIAARSRPPADCRPDGSEPRPGELPEDGAPSPGR
ncbi:hypothetical protein [Streptomyces sp. TP-A0874]|uniref:hypothetical protein n=1 Tax=Streptomyces sp. TP-A0874 TaxID=549819 RepID=UPI000852E0CB|nr:hypothetical protein [Streptomyces sp. TP-A0874]